MFGDIINDVLLIIIIAKQQQCAQFVAITALIV